ncbi:MAG: hypothetical protein JO055_15205 [Alphaproteobacteria bacterium]|nr:hypothetical protein [Alphaproteobacteria bacterium]
MSLLRPSISVVYLARAAEGIEAIERFRQSYTNHPAGIPHDLVVCLKGDDESEIARAKEVLTPIATRFVAQSDEGFDIHAYLRTAQTVDTEWISCLNTFSVINKPLWLERLYRAASRPGVGLVGATASYESRHSTIGAWIWYLGKVLDGDVLQSSTHDQFADIIRALENGYRIPGVARVGRRLKLWALFEEPYRRRHLRLWRQRMSVHPDYEGAPMFPAFPNPHVRSNGFLVRTKFLTSRFPELGLSKMDCLKFESGLEGLSASIVKDGASLLLVGEKGEYPVDDWPQSKTFRSGDQEDLLIRDNQTDIFSSLPPINRELLRYFTWGDAAADPEQYEIPPLRCFKNIESVLLQTPAANQGALS